MICGDAVTLSVVPKSRRRSGLREDRHAYPPSLISTSPEINLPEAPIQYALMCDQRASRSPPLIDGSTVPWPSSLGIFSQETLVQTWLIRDPRRRPPLISANRRAVYALTIDSRDIVPKTLVWARSEHRLVICANRSRAPQVRPDARPRWSTGTLHWIIIFKRAVSVNEE